jgi:hypothetical protein
MLVVTLLGPPDRAVKQEQERSSPMDISPYRLSANALCRIEFVILAVTPI